MTFQVSGLPVSSYQELFDLDDVALAKIQAERRIATAFPGAPCRISLEDAQVGEELILLNHAHLPETSPYQSRHAIYVRKGVDQADLKVDEIPDFFKHRDISVRAFDANHIMVNACVVPKNGDVKSAVDAFFENEKVDYIHFHFAAPGCFAAKAIRN